MLLLQITKFKREIYIDNSPYINVSRLKSFPSAFPTYLKFCQEHIVSYLLLQLVPFSHSILHHS